MDSTAFDRACECNHLPDACTNDIREEKLIQRQEKDDRPWIHRVVSRDRNLFIACAVLIVAMNVSTGRYLLYPFLILGTWVHEMCHGLAAIMTGGSITKLQIFRDGSGLAFSTTKGDWYSGFVASGGYPGTAVTGCLLLLFRRTTLGPTIGCIGLGVCILLSCLLYVRNKFGLIMLPIEAVFLLLAAWKLPAVWLDNFYNFLSVAICLNAVESIHDLFGYESSYAGGRIRQYTDAHTVAEIWGGDHRMWATIWFVASLVLTFIGIVFAFNARETVRRY